MTAVVKWRRSDALPLEKAVFITDGGNTTVRACRMISATTDVATFEFTPTSMGGPYYAYYMPFTTCEYRGGTCRSSARVNYLKPGANGSCSVFTAVRTTGDVDGLVRRNVDHAHPVHPGAKVHEARGRVGPRRRVDLGRVGKDADRDVHVTVHYQADLKTGIRAQ